MNNPTDEDREVVERELDALRVEYPDWRRDTYVTDEDYYAATQPSGIVAAWATLAVAWLFGAVCGALLSQVVWR